MVWKESARLSWMSGNAARESIKSGPPRFYSDRRSRNSSVPRVLVVYPVEATFVRTDLELLSTFCNVTPFHFGEKSSYLALAKAIFNTDIVFSWFAEGFAALGNLGAWLLGKRTITVAGGWDVVGMREIGYGMLLKRRGKWQARVALSSADLVLPFSDWSEAAIRRIVPKCRTHRAYLGVDVDKFRPSSKENIVVSVANITRENLTRKGLRAFVTASRSIPEVRFVLVGRHYDGAIEELRALAGDNISFPGWLLDSDLRDQQLLKNWGIMIWMF